MRQRLVLLMAVFAAAGSFNVTTAAATNTVQVTGLTDGDGGGSFTPTLVLFFWSGRTESTTTVGRASQNRGFGVAVSTTSRWAIGSQSTDAAGSAVTSSSATLAACIISCADTAIDGAMDLQSMDSGGFTLVIDDQFPTDLRVGFLALGGDVTATTGVFTAAGTAPVTQSVAHGLGSTPAAVLFGCSRANSGLPLSIVDSSLMVGMMSGASNEGVVSGASNDAANTMQTMGYGTSTECIALFGGTIVSLGNRAEFSSIDGTNFVINWLARDLALRIPWLAIGGTNVQAIVGNLNTRTDTDDIVETIGFRPKGILFAGANHAEDTSPTPTDHDWLSFGAAASASQQVSLSGMDEDNVGTSEVTTSFTTTDVNVRADTTHIARMALISIENNGFTTEMVATEPTTGRWVMYLAVGVTVAVTGTPWLHYRQLMQA